MNPNLNQLTLVRGLPGTGKSTWAKNHFNCLILETDQYFIHNNIYQWNPNTIHIAHQHTLNLTKELITHQDVTVVNTFTTLKELQPYLNLKANIQIFHIKGKNLKNNSIHNVPDATITKMSQRWQQIPNEITINQNF